MSSVIAYSHNYYQLIRCYNYKNMLNKPAKESIHLNKDIWMFQSTSIKYHVVLNKSLNLHSNFLFKHMNVTLRTSPKPGLIHIRDP